MKKTSKNLKAGIRPRPNKAENNVNVFAFQSISV